MSCKTALGLSALLALALAAGCSSTKDDPDVIVIPLAVTTASLPDALTGAAYSQTLQAEGGAPPYAWSLAAGALPAGLSLDGIAGEIAGTPTGVEIASFTVRVTDAVLATADRALTLTAAGATPTIVTATLKDGTTGGAYGEFILAVGGQTPYAWSLVSGALPAGLSLDANLGQVLGSPATPGTSNFTVRVTDANTATDDRALSLTVNPAPTVTTTSLPKGIVGAAYGQTLAASGGTAPLVWAVVSGTLPGGLSLDSGTGILSGTPTASGTFAFTVRVADDYGAFGDQALTLVIEDPLVVGTASLPAGKVGQSYNQTLAATGGVLPYAWSVSSGALPPGLTLTGTTGVISGTPTVAGTSSFTVQCADGGTQTDTAALSIRVDPNTFPRLLVANSASPVGVKIWNNVNNTTSDRASDATLGGFTTDGALALCRDADRLFAASNSPTTALYLWDNASAAGGGAAPTDALPVSAFAGSALFTVYDMFVDASGNLYVCYGSIRLFLGAASLTNASASQAQFTHAWGPQIYAMASDTAGGKLIGGQVSGAGMICWNGPATKSGETNAEDWTLQAGGTPSHAVIAGNRLYATSYSGPDFVRIWDNVSSLTATTAPTATLGAASSLGAAVHVHVKNDFLFVTVNSPPTYKVCVWANASSITGDTAPAFQITDAAMALPIKSALGNDGRLYVMDQNGILIFRGATTAPAFLCEITTDVSGPRDFLLME